MTLEQPIGLLGGTFDPIHLGHLHLGRELQRHYRLSKVHFIPCLQPVHRPAPIASPAERLTMVELAIADEPNFVLNKIELERSTPSYTIDTLQTLRQIYPNSPFCLLFGMDAFLSFLSWRQPYDILSLSHLIVAHRPKQSLKVEGALASLLGQHHQDDMNYVHEHLAGGILLRSITALDVSATDIREMIAQEKDVKHLLPLSVYGYIKENGLYKTMRK